MRKGYLIGVVVIILLLFLLPKLLKKSNITRYNIDNFEVEEKLVSGKIHLTITLADKTYYYLHSGSKKRVVKNIELYEDDYNSCIYMTFDSDQKINDLLCYSNNTNYYFSTLENTTELLDNAYRNLVSSGKIVPITDDRSNTRKIDLFTIYLNNLSKNFIFCLTNYKGLYLLEEDIKEIKLFESDVYDQKIKLFLGNYYIIADYNQQYDFKAFYLVNLKNEKISKFEFKYNISFNSEILYTEGNDFYLQDNDNKVIYKIDAINKSIKIVNESDLLDSYQKYIEDFEIVQETEHNYYLKKNEILYKTYSKTLDDIYFLFDISSKQNIKASDNYVCYLEMGDISCYYQNGYKTIVSSEEFAFNKMLDYYILER